MQLHVLMTKQINDTCTDTQYTCVSCVAEARPLFEPNAAEKKNMHVINKCQLQEDQSDGKGTSSIVQDWTSASSQFHLHQIRYDSCTQILVMASVRASYLNFWDWTVEAVDNAAVEESSLFHILS